MAKTTGETKPGGLYHVSIGRVDSSFYHKGTAADPNTIADGTTLNAIHVGFPMTFTQANPTLSVEKTKGGNQPGPSIVLGQDDPGEAGLVLALENETLSALIEGITIDASTASDWQITGRNPRLDTRYKYIVIVSAKAIGDGIQVQWVNYCYLNADVYISEYPGATQEGGTNSQPQSLVIIPDQSTRHPWGSLLSTGSNAFTDNKTDYLRIRSDNPLTLTTYVATVTTPTQFVLGFRPTTTDVASASNMFSKDGVTDGPTSCTIATGVVVIPVPGAAEQWIAFYETAFQAI